jgi:hypothetical protein
MDKKNKNTTFLFSNGNENNEENDTTLHIIFSIDEVIRNAKSSLNK